MERWLKLSTGVACALAVGFVTFGVAAADEAFKPTAIVTLNPGQTIKSFDISYVDPVLGLYVLADRTNKAVDVVDTGTNTQINQFGAGLFAGATPSNNNAGPDGVFIVNHRELWAGDGNSTIKVFDLAGSNSVPTHVINTGGANRADEGCVDEEDHVVLMANDAESPFPFISFISTTSYTVLKRVTFDGNNGTVAATNGIEQCQFDKRTHKFYLNIPEVNGPGNDSQPGATVVLSPTTFAVEHIYMIPLADCAGPQGMAIGPEPQILLGCNVAVPNPSTVIINKHNGHVLATLANESGSDEVWFNPGDGHYFLARSSAAGANQELGVVDSRGPNEDASFPIGLTSTTASPHGTAHSVAADSESNHAFVPIPSTAGGTVCSSAGGNDSLGCIAVFTTTHDDRVACNAQGSPVIRAGDGDHDADDMKARCHDRDRD
jgi:hypothetical protein